ncbi:MAG: efflux RND transporter periplasmic adaptor subunit [Rhodospirillales bacterium]|nr:efflux RND transporter periplasmic adaptor subunit [Rhodospirillales bacterium]
MGRNRVVFVSAAVLLIGVGVYYSGNFFGRTSTTAPDAKASTARVRTVPVVAATVQRQAVDVNLNVIGTAQAYASVAVRSRVDGQLLNVHFREGQAVRKGDKLITIDSRPYEAQLRQAEANLARDRAQLVRAKADLERYTDLMRREFSSKQKFDEATANAAALEATVRADVAAVDSARLQLDYTSILSPIDARAGSLLINTGNLVKANDTNAIVVLNQIRPIYVSFSVAEQYLPEVRRQMAAGVLKVSVVVPSEPDRPEHGIVTFINNTVDPASGTIMLKATVENAEDRLLPGQFVNVVLTRSTLPDALVLPSQAIQNAQEGTYVFVIKPDLSVEYRRVVVGPSSDGRTVIREGVGEGERVVTEGQLRLAAGRQVEIKPGT